MLSARRINEKKMKETPKKELKFRNRKPNEERRTARVTISLKPSEKSSLASNAKKYNMTLGDLFLRFDSRKELDETMSRSKEWIKIDYED